MSDSEHDWLRPEEEHETETVIDAGTAQSNPEVADAVAKIAALRQSIDNVDTAIVSYWRNASNTRPKWVC